MTSLPGGGGGGGVLYTGGRGGAGGFLFETFIVSTWTGYCLEIYNTVKLSKLNDINQLWTSV